MIKKYFISCTLIITILVASYVLKGQDLPKRELRAAWIATVVNIDWPSKRGLSAQQQQEEYVKLLDHLKSVGMNAVIVQVRPTADTFYPSSFEPWSEFLSGVQGQSVQPYYNPLAFMIEQAKQRGLEFHAWFNPYRASMNKEFIPSENHPIKKYPEWFLKYGGKWYYDPGYPEAREFVLQSIIETVKHYDLDAVHFDDYFYPYKVPGEDFPDSASYAAFNVDSVDLESWRRYNVDFFVEELAKRIKEEKPFVKFGISPFGVWRNKDKDPRGSDTKAGVTNYDDLYADVLKWLREGWIDYITPQIYWHIGFERAEYKTLVDWWSKNTYGKHLYIGQAAYRMGQKGWEDPNEIINQVNFNRTFKQVDGSMYFSAKSFMNNNDGVNEKMKITYPYTALVPTMPWIDDEPPAAPILENITGSQRDGVKLEWKDGLPGENAYYAIYRFDEDEQVDINNPANIVATVPHIPYFTQSWVDRSTSKRTRYTYVITALDRLHNESRSGNKVSVKTRGKRGKVKSEI